MCDSLINAITNIPNNIKARYALALLTVFIASLYKPYSASNRILLATIALYFAYGINQLMFIILTISLNITLLKLNSRYANEYVFIVINILILYFFKIFGYRIEPLIQTTYDISGFLMVLVIKISYLVRDIRTIETAKETQVLTVDTIEYLVFLPGLLSGPTLSFQEFISTNKTEKKQLPLKQSLKTLLFLSIYLRFNKYPFKSLILSEDTPLPTRLVLLYLYNVVLRTKFHFIWNFSHCCYILYGRDEFLNIDFFKVEFTESVREISSNWNRFVTRWLKEMFFIKLKSTSMSPTMAAIVTHLISASLHGLNACYLVFFMSLGTFSKLITRINGLIPVKFIRQFQMVWFITFFSMPFYLLNLKETYLIWKAVYFYGLVYCIGMSLLFASYDFIRTRKVSIISKAPQMEIYVKNK